MKLLHQSILLIFTIILLPYNTYATSAITIEGQKIIDRPTVFRNSDLDMSHGYFLITNNATLTIENSSIRGTVSPENPYLINMIQGNLIVKNNNVNVTSKNIEPSPTKATIYKVISVTQGNVNMSGNTFDIDKPYTTSLLVTGHALTSNFVIRNNKIHNFHGAIFLSNSNNALIEKNHFSNVSITNMFTKNGNDSIFRNNTILFSGNNSVGNAVDILDSNNILLYNNFISLGSCYSVVVLRSKNIVIDSNQIVGGITYALYITPSIGLKGPYDHHLFEFIDPKKVNEGQYQNKNITIINNYFSQNRFGLTATSVDGLIVKNNTFLQRFSDTTSRKFWTNNDNLLQEVDKLTWENNRYKEAFTQNMMESNDKASQFIPFPTYGGVTL